MQVFRILRTCFLVTIGRFFSRAESLSAAWGMLRHCATHLLQALPRGVWTSFGLSAGGYVTVLLAGLVLFCVSLQQERGVRVRTALAAKRPVVQFPRAGRGALSSAGDGLSQHRLHRHCLCL